MTVTEMLKPGDRVRVVHIGLDKIGVVTRVGRVLYDAEVPVYGGKRTKVLHGLRIEEVRRV